MTKFDEIMELVEKRDTHIRAGINWIDGPVWKREEIANGFTKANEALRTAIESLVKDAEQWRAYKTRRDAIIAAGMGRNILRKEQGEAS